MQLQICIGAGADGKKHCAATQYIFSSLFERDSENQTHVCVVSGTDFFRGGFGWCTTFFEGREAYREPRGNEDLLFRKKKLTKIQLMTFLVHKHRFQIKTLNYIASFNKNPQK
jgi:hypothetical protein